MSDDLDKAVIDFIVSKVNPHYLAAYNTLVKLKYPINDYSSFCEQLPISNASGLNKLIRLIIEPKDMPFMTAQGAMEKFHAILLSILDTGRTRLRNPRDEQEIPDDSGPTSIHPDDIRRICENHAREVADRLVNPTPQLYFEVYAYELFKCIRELSSGGPPPRPPKLEDFVGRH